MMIRRRTLLLGSRWWLLAGMLPLAVAAHVWHARRAASEGDKAHVVVETFLSQSASLRGRLVGLSHGSTAVDRSNSGPNAAKSPHVRLQIAVLEDEADRRPSVTSLGRAARACLAASRHSAAIALLGRAIRLEQSVQRGSLLSDLAAAHIARGDATGEVQDFVRAMDAALRALALGPAPEAWHNLAVAYESLHLDDLAKSAWTTVAGYHESGWSSVAKAHADAFRVASRETRTKALAKSTLEWPVTEVSRVVAHEIDIFGEILERLVLDEWAAATLSGDDGLAHQRETLATGLAAALTAATDDDYWTSLVREAFAGSHRDRRTFAEGWRSYVAGAGHWEADRYPEARRPLELAGRVLRGRRAAGSASDLHLSSFERLDGRVALADLRLARVASLAREQRFLRLEGRALWQRGLLASEAGRFGTSLAHLESAKELLDRAGDREGGAVVRSLLASHYGRLHQHDSAWKMQGEALSGLAHARRIRRDPILWGAAALASGSEMFAAAVQFREPAVADARAAGSNVGLAFLLADQVPDLLSAGRRDEARAALDDAREALARVDDIGTVEMAAALHRITEARLEASVAPKRAARLLEQAIDLYRRRGNEFATPPLQLERAQLLRRAGAEPDVEHALADGITVADRQRRALGDRRQRVSMHRTTWGLHTAMADVRVARGDPDGAFELLERGRAINLLERRPAQRPRWLAVGRDVSTLVYAELPSGFVGWLLARDERRFFRVAATGSQLGELVERYRALVLERRDEEALQQSEELFRLLLEPAGIPEQANLLVIVPDGVLTELPFAGLRNPRTRRLLIETVGTAVAPSARMADQAPFGARAKVPHTVVVAGIHRADGLGLPPLPGSESEGDRVAKTYRNSTFIRGTDATAGRVWAALQAASVFHFAGHARVNHAEPELSRLVLATSSDDKVGSIFAEELEAADLPHLELAVLAGGDTGRGVFSRGEGVLGLARSFLASGVSSVLATLWPIEDRRASELFVAFHRQWANGVGAADALRTAQLGLLRSPDSALADWVGTIAIGSHLRRVERH